jgi:phosphate transport system ATP-binding protein
VGERARAGAAAGPGAAIPGAPAAPLFAVEGLRAAYGSTPALEDVHATIPDAGVTAIMGPSGCGKTTFVKALNRTLELVPGARVVAGRVLFRGLDLHAPGVDPRAVRRAIGIIHQRPVVFPMSILENVLFGARFHGLVPRGRREEFAEAHLRAVGLWDEVKDRLREPGHRLSGGQQQRLCLARTLANGPSVVLMDEPCSSLDPAATRRIEEHVADLKARLPIVIVTHNLAQARRVSDFVLFFMDRRLVEAGPAERLFSAPATAAARDFVAGRTG